MSARVGCVLGRGKMKKIPSIFAAFLGVTTAAYAADMPAKVPPPAPAAFDWSGCYIGVEGGGGWGRSEQVAAATALAASTITGRFNLDGGLAGGTGGCNLEYNNFVFGLEDDFSWTNIHGSHNDLPPFVTTTLSETHEKWLNTLRGRVGYAIDRVMVYGTVGAALAGTQVLVSNPAIFGTLADHQVHSGWVAGAGVEWAFWSLPWADVTFKAEYLHADFGSTLYFNPSVVLPGATIVTRETHLSDDIVRAGVNLKFNPGGATVVAKQ
jgi:outer membrane immunogenic protein